MFQNVFWTENLKIENFPVPIFWDLVIFFISTNSSSKTWKILKFYRRVSKFFSSEFNVKYVQMFENQKNFQVPLKGVEKFFVSKFNV